MKKYIIGVCVMFMSGMATLSIAEEAVAEKTEKMSVSSFEDVARILEAMDKRLKDLEARIGPHLPESETMTQMHKDIRELKSDVRRVNQSIDRVQSDLRRVERRR